MTTQIIKHAIAPSLNKTVVEHCQLNQFSLSVDESNDRGGEKLLVILLKIYDPAKGTDV